jgi:hypothetical protein
MTIATANGAEALRRLRLFNEKAAELQSYSFIAKALHRDAGITINFDSEMVEAKRVGCDNEARAAMCLVLRFFLQPRDRIELHQIAELYETLPVKPDDKQFACDNLKRLDDFLDRPTELSFNGASPLTYRMIVDTFMYGDQAHTNDDKRATLEAWKVFGPAYLFLENCFEYAVVQVVRYIAWQAGKNVDAIRVLEQATSESPVKEAT